MYSVQWTVYSVHTPIPYIDMPISTCPAPTLHAVTANVILRAYIHKSRARAQTYAYAHTKSHEHLNLPAYTPTQWRTHLHIPIYIPSPVSYTHHSNQRYHVNLTLPVCHDLYFTLYTLNIAHCTLYTVHCTLYIVHYTMYIGECTLYTIQYTVNIQCRNDTMVNLYCQSINPDPD